MFRKMRRSAQAMENSRCREVLMRNTSGVLSLLDENGYTYGVPLSYLLHENTIYFHGAKVGAKIDAVRHHDKVSFTVIDRDEVIPEEYTTHYRSVIAFGRIRILTDAAEMNNAIRALARRYSPNESAARIEQTIIEETSRMAILALEIEHLSGKESMALKP